MSSVILPDMSMIPGVYPLLFEKGNDTIVGEKDSLAVELLSVLKTSHPTIDLHGETIDNPTDVISLRDKVYNYKVVAKDSWTCVSFIDVTPYHAMLIAWQNDFNIIKTAHSNLMNTIQDSLQS